MKKVMTARQRLALRRVETLFEQAVVRPAFAKRYVALARRMSLRHKVRLPLKWRRRFCRNCNALLTPGRNCVVRVRGARVVMTCMDCGSVRRIGLR